MVHAEHEILKRALRYPEAKFREQLATTNKDKIMILADFKTYETVRPEEIMVWFKAAPISKFPKNGGACIKYKDKQVAIFNFTREGTWYACQNLCPHKMEMVLSRGMIGEENLEPKVACPLHKNTFSLKTGENLNGSLGAIATYPVKIENGFVYVGFAD